MQTLDQKRISTKRTGRNGVGAGKLTSLLPILFAACAVLAAGCKKDAAEASIETDANGFICMKCGAKFYTERKESLGAKCPKCQEYGLEDVVGYLCTNDNHITIRPRVSGPEGASVCEKCGAHLVNAMVMPHEKDLVAWGAIKTEPR